MTNVVPINKPALSYQPSNLEFLQAIFGVESIHVHVTGFVDDPSAIANDRRGACWGGTWYSLADGRGVLPDGANQYFCISVFNPETGSNGLPYPVRRKSNFIATFCLVADDVESKIPREQAARLPEPAWKLETSPGNFQWGWILRVPETDRHRVDALLDGLVAQGLAPDGTDPGMRGVTRYVRLPEGTNTKARYGIPFRCRMTEWQPDRRTTLEELAAPFEVDLTAQVGAAEAYNHAHVENHPVLDHVTVLADKAEGSYLIECPWLDNHTDGDDSGTILFVHDDGSIGFKCHHGGCIDRTAADLLEELDLREELDGWRGRRALEEGFAAVPLVTPESEAWAQAQIQRVEIPGAVGDGGAVGSVETYIDPQVTNVVALLLHTLHQGAGVESWVQILHGYSLRRDLLGLVLRQIADQGLLGVGIRDLKNTYRDYEQALADELVRQELAGKAPEQRLSVRLWESEVSWMTREVEGRLVADGNVFRFAGGPACVTYDRIPYTHQIGDVSEEAPAVAVINRYSRATMHDRVEKSAVFYKVKLGQEDVPERRVPIMVPEKVVSFLLENYTSGLPELRGLSTTPVVLANGVIMDKQGYDANTQLYISYSGDRLADGPGMTPAEGLRILKAEMFEEFEFATLGDEATAIACYLSTVQRKLLTIAPGYLFNADIQGSGKTTLAAVIHATVTGRQMPVTTLPDNLDEARKALFSQLMLSPTILCFDNVPDGFNLNHSAISAMLTSGVFSQRVLGESRVQEVSTATTLVFTGNNLTFGGDMIRRFLECRLAPKELRPEHRVFRHKAPIEHAIRNRHRWIQAALAILRTAAFAADGQEPSGFPEWDHAVRWPLMAAGSVDPLITQQTIREASPDTARYVAQMKGLLSIYPRGTGFQTRSLAKRLALAFENDANYRFSSDDLLVQQFSESTPRSGRWTPRSVGLILEKLKGKNIDGHRLIYERKDGVKLWEIR